MALSRLAGWAADRRIPSPLRTPVYRAWARLTGSDLSEVGAPLREYESLSSFFARTLEDGARPIAKGASQIVSPADGVLQAAGVVESGSLLQAKGHSYSVHDLLGSDADGAACEGGLSWTIYLSPRDYHRVHSPEEGRLVEVRRIPGARYSVAPGVLARRSVLPVNERVVMRIETARGILWLVMVGALNVGRIRIEGVRTEEQGPLAPARRFARGQDLARFELGSTVILIAPPGAVRGRRDLAAGARVRVGEPIGEWCGAHAAVGA